MANKETTFIKLYGFKLLSSIIIILANIIIQMIVARSLGKNDYGYYNYNLIFFSTAMSFIYAGTSDAYYSKISKRRDEYELTQFYLYYNIFIFIVINIVIAALILTGISKYIWEYQNSINILLALYLAHFTYILSIFSNLADAYALTKTTEIGKSIQKSIVLFFTVLIFGIGRLNLQTFYIIQIIATLLILGQIYIFFTKAQIVVIKKVSVLNLFNRYKNEFYIFCKPMFFVLLLSSVLTMAENWLVIHYSSTSEQAYYGIANQINSILSYIFTPLVLLLIREFAISHNDKDKLAGMFLKCTKATYVLISYFACFIMINADWVCFLFGGSEYLKAGPVVEIIMLYSMGQTMGQINGSMYIASERTKKFGAISLLGIGLSLVFDYFLLIPNFIITKGLGAVGLALKMFFVQIIIYNILLFFNSKYLNMKFRKLFFIQFISPSIFLVCAYSIRYLINNLVKQNLLTDNSFLLVLISGLVYSLFVIIIIYIFPGIIDMKNPKQILDYLRVKNKEE